jgi:hypothetical protein
MDDGGFNLDAFSDLDLWELLGLETKENKYPFQFYMISRKKVVMKCLFVFFAFPLHL